MEWLSQWVRNLAFYFIFLSVLMNVIPQGEERKYIRFFMGLLLILVLDQTATDRRKSGSDPLLGDTFGRNPAGIRGLFDGEKISGTGRK